MNLSDIAVRLADLHESPGYRVAQFDAGPPPSGRVAVLPSAYNPPTLAHASLLELAGDLPGVDTTAALLTTNNVDKSLFGAPLSHRIGMLLALREALPGIHVMGSNAARLLDQGEALRVEHPGVRFDFVAGYDVLVRVFNPKYYEDMRSALDRFFGAHRLLATNRAQATVDAVKAYLDEPIVRDYAERIVVLELPADHSNISSTAARVAAAKGEPPPALTPEVAAYIREHALYGATDH